MTVRNNNCDMLRKQIRHILQITGVFRLQLRVVLAQVVHRGERGSLRARLDSVLQRLRVFRPDFLPLHRFAGPTRYCSSAFPSRGEALAGSSGIHSPRLGMLRKTRSLRGHSVWRMERVSQVLGALQVSRNRRDWEQRTNTTEGAFGNSM